MLSPLTFKGGLLLSKILYISTKSGSGAPVTGSSLFGLSVIVTPKLSTTLKPLPFNINPS